MIDKLYCSYYSLISTIHTRCMRLVWRAVFTSQHLSSIASSGPVSWSASLLGVTYRQLISSYQHCSVCSSSSATPFPSCNHRFVNDGINIHVLLQCTQCSWLNRILKVSPHYFRCEIFLRAGHFSLTCIRSLLQPHTYLFLIFPGKQYKSACCRSSSVSMVPARRELLSQRHHVAAQEE